MSYSPERLSVTTVFPCGRYLSVNVPVIIFSPPICVPFLSLTTHVAHNVYILLFGYYGI